MGHQRHCKGTRRGRGHQRHCKEQENEDDKGSGGETTPLRKWTELDTRLSRATEGRSGQTETEAAGYDFIDSAPTTLRKTEIFRRK